MTIREQAVREIQEAPEEAVREALDFLRYLAARATRQETARASEAALARDWNALEEDEPWANL